VAPTRGTCAAIEEAHPALRPDFHDDRQTQALQWQLVPTVSIRTEVFCSRMIGYDPGTAAQITIARAVRPVIRLSTALVVSQGQ